MSYFMIDDETDGPAPGLFSMICFGAVVVRPGLADTFYGRCKPISENWEPEALAVSGFTREQTMEFENPAETMQKFFEWINRVTVGKPMFIADNDCFDWQFINYYFHKYLGKNPFGYSGTNLGSLYKGLVGDCYKNFKHLRKTKHTHDPVMDSMGNAEALLYMRDHMGLKINLE